jgi:hypothetical protein
MQVVNWALYRPTTGSIHAHCTPRICQALVQQVVFRKDMSRYLSRAHSVQASARWTLQLLQLLLLLPCPGPRLTTPSSNASLIKRAVS